MATRSTTARVTNDEKEIRARGWRTVVIATPDDYLLDCAHMVEREYEGIPYLVKCPECHAL